jgi:hypothetical protein
VRDVPDSACAQATSYVTRPLQDEAVVPVGVEWMAPAEALIHDQGFAAGSGKTQRNVERRILVVSHGMVHPVQDVATFPIDRSVLQHARSFCEVLRQRSQHLAISALDVHPYRFHAWSVTARPYRASYGPSGDGLKTCGPVRR